MLTLDIDLLITNLTSHAQTEALRRNYEEFGVPIYSLGNANQGIICVVGLQFELTQPGMTIVCGNSHTSTHGAFGSFALGIGTSEVEYMLAMQALPLAPFKMMVINVDGGLKPGTTARDIVLAIIAKIGTNGAQGRVIEYRGKAIHSLSMEAQTMVCNVPIEAGARVGMVALGKMTFAYVEGGPNTLENWDEAVAYRCILVTDGDAEFDTIVEPDADKLEPFVTWGTNPGQGVRISGKISKPTDTADETQRKAAEGTIEYMGLIPGTPMWEVDIDAALIGSCTDGHIEDPRVAAGVIEGRRKTPKTRAMAVPGPARVRLQAKTEGLDKVFPNFGAEWHSTGCSMCLGMNPGQLNPEEWCASTLNRNFQGRQGPGGWTHLISPLVVATTVVKGEFATPSNLG